MKSSYTSKDTDKGPPDTRAWEAEGGGRNFVVCGKGYVVIAYLELVSLEWVDSSTYLQGLFSSVQFRSVPFRSVQFSSVQFSSVQCSETQFSAVK